MTLYLMTDTNVIKYCESATQSSITNTSEKIPVNGPVFTIMQYDNGTATFTKLLHNEFTQLQLTGNDLVQMAQCQKFGTQHSKRQCDKTNCCYI